MKSEGISEKPIVWGAPIFWGANTRMYVSNKLFTILIPNLAARVLYLDASPGVALLLLP